MSRQVVIGPPGTGKTTYLMGVIADLIKRDWRQPRDVAFVSYSKAAVATARERIGKATERDASEFDNFRTLHSTFTRALGLKMGRDFVEPRHLRDFYKIAGYAAPAPEDDDDLLEGIDDPSRGALLMGIYDYARQTMRPLEAASASLHGVTMDELTMFVERYDLWREKLRLNDYTDVLIKACRAGLTIPAPLLFIDEAQDLSPLQIALLAPSIERAERVWVAGDDDQAIYAYQGASPRWLISLWDAGTWDRKLLDVSHRCPEQVRELAVRVVERCGERIAKEYRSRAGDGSVTRGGWDYAVSAIRAIGPNERAYVLCRTGRFCANAANNLFDLGIPYLSVGKKGGANPFGNQKLLAAIEVLSALADGKRITTREFVEVATYLRHIRAARAVDAAPITHVTAADAARFGFADLVTDNAGDLLTRLHLGYRRRYDHRDEAAWLVRQWLANGKTWPAPRVTVMTWHASKGQEAELVVLDPSLNRRCINTLTGQSPDEEHRCAYVAATRTKRDLVILYPNRNAAGEYEFKG